MVSSAQVEMSAAQAVESLVGLECWYVSSGAIGATFELALGRKVPRPVPLRNPTHSEEFRRNEGEANLLVWCSWRLDGATEPLTSSDDSSDHIQSQLEKLSGARVVDVLLQPPGWDLTISFSNDLRLRVFCDHVPGDPSFDGNWELVFEHAALYAGPGVRLEMENR